MASELLLAAASSLDSIRPYLTDSFAAWFGAVTGGVSLVHDGLKSLREWLAGRATLEAQQILLEAKDEHRARVSELMRASTPCPSVRHRIAEVTIFMADGVLVQRGRLGKESIAALIRLDECVNSAHAQHDGYRVVFRVDEQLEIVG